MKTEKRCARAYGWQGSFSSSPKRNPCSTNRNGHARLTPQNRRHHRARVHLTWREASEPDIPLLAEWNHQLIRDEGHRNPMNAAQLAERMRGWLDGEYRAVLFSSERKTGGPVAYALYKQEPHLIYLRHFFVVRQRRRQGIGRAAVSILREQIWPRDVRLTVDVLCHNLGGVDFWRSVGYRDHCLTMEIMPR